MSALRKERVRRDYTRSPEISGEDIVRTAWRHAESRRNDVTRASGNKFCTLVMQVMTLPQLGSLLSDEQLQLRELLETPEVNIATT